MYVCVYVCVCVYVYVVFCVKGLVVVVDVDGTSTVELVIAIEFTVVTARVCTSYPVVPLQKCCIPPLSWCSSSSFCLPHRPNCVADDCVARGVST